jgi:hypothetical protein
MLSVINDAVGCSELTFSRRTSYWGGREMGDGTMLVELESVIQEGHSLSEDLLERGQRYGTELLESRSKKWVYSTLNLLKLRFGEKSNFVIQFQAEFEKADFIYKQNIERATAILEYIRESLEKGLTEDLFFKQRLEIYSDVLHQAEEFLKQGHRLAAAIYGKIALENAISYYAKKKGIADTMKFDQLIIKLRQAGMIQAVLEHSLRSNYAIGSAAALGDPTFQKYSRKELEEYLRFIRDEVLSLT